MSDDERLSLTTAISDDDDGEPRDSPYRAKSGAAAAAFNCTGAVRKAGFLSVKKWLLRKRHQIELARKRGWKGYWVCLKGTTLLFYPCDSRDGRAIESTPKHLIIIDGCIMQPIPEHPKRDFIFCLSTAFGDAYLFQAPCQLELDNWISAIHSACGAAFARHRGKSGALHLLQDEIQRMDRQVEVDAKLKHMAELQLSVVADPDSRRALQEQIRAHDESLEQNHGEQFRLRCYMASIQNSELPNPKTLLAYVSKTTKSILNRLGVFTVSSFHAYICARSPSMLTNVISGRGNTCRRRSGSARSSSQRTSSTTGSGAAAGSRSSSAGRGAGNETVSTSGDKLLRLILPPDDSLCPVYVKGSETVEELLWSVLTDKHLSPIDHFLRLKKPSGEYYVPARHESVDLFPAFDAAEVLPKILFQVELIRSSLDQLFGFSVEAELVESSDLGDHSGPVCDELCVYVSRVEDMSLASSQGLQKGDEIMVINGSLVSDLDMMFIESVLQEELSLCMMLRSCRLEPPDMGAIVRSTDEYIESLVCPPPPTDGNLTDDAIGKLIIPSPNWNNSSLESDGSSRDQRAAHYGRPSSRSKMRAGMQVAAAAAASAFEATQAATGEQIAETLLKSAEEVTSEYCRMPSSVGGGGGSQAGTLTRQQSASSAATASTISGAAAAVVAAAQALSSASGAGTSIGGSSGAYYSLPPSAMPSSVLHTTQMQIHGTTAASVASVTGSGPMAALLAQQQQVQQQQQLYAARSRGPLSDADKLRKVIRELIDTEATYVEVCAFLSPPQASLLTLAFAVLACHCHCLQQIRLLFPF